MVFAGSSGKVQGSKKHQISLKLYLILIFLSQAIFGIIAWIFLGSIGILLARYYKPLWPNHVLHSFRVWFSVNKFFNVKYRKKISSLTKKKCIS